MMTFQINVPFLLLIAINLQFINGNETSKEILHLGVLISQEGGTDLSGYIPAMNIALETIENDTTLPFIFRSRINDSKCQAAPSVRSFISQVFSTSFETPQIMLIGADCSVATEPVAEISNNWNLVQISPGSSSPRLSNTEVFPHFLRTVSSDAEIITGIIQLMRQFGWSRVALITQSENIFTFIATMLREELAKLDIQLLREFIFNSEENVTQAMLNLKNSPARVVFLNMYEEHAAEAMCVAYNNKMHHPEYAWMFFSWYSDRWWFDELGSCVTEAENLEKVVETSIVLDHYPRIEEHRKDEQNIGKITWNYYFTEHRKRFKELEVKAKNDFLPHTEDGAYIFDAIWAAALALNRTKAILDEKNLTFMNFNYDNGGEIAEYIYNETLNVKFFGLTGDVFFRSNGDRPGKVRLLQYRRGSDGNLSRVLFAKIIEGSLVYEEGKDDYFVYGDNVLQDEEHFYISLPLFTVYTILSLFGMTFAVFCLIFELRFRNQKLVKLGSPNVNIMIIAGAIVFYTIVILFGMDENVVSYTTVDRLCHARIWLVAIGFSLLYGTIFAKTWRIYYIFNYAKPNIKFEVKDMYLFGFVGILVLVDIIFMIPTTVVSSARLRRDQNEIEGNNPDDLPAIIGVCTSKGSLIWLPVLFAYKGFVLLAGLFLAFETRKVKIKSLNESRFVAMSVYGAVIVSIALTPIGFLLENYPTTQYAIIGITILLSTSLILGLVFVSKMYKVYKDPEGKRYLEDPTSHHTSTIQKTVTISSETEESYKKRIENLNEEIKVLSDELEKYKSGRIESKVIMVPEKLVT